MLTVLIKHKDTGRDVLFEADSVEFQEQEAPGQEPGAGLLLMHDKEGQATHFGPSDRSDDVRDVFVMNANGQTVARYTL